MRSLFLVLLVACQSKGSNSSGIVTTSGATTGIPGGTSSCFVAGTPVRTLRGDVAIEDLRVGDAVVSWTLDEGRVVREVTALHRSCAPEIVELVLEDRVIRTTSEHPFFDWDAGDWVEAGRVVSGDRLTVLGRGLQPIEVVDVGRSVGEPVFNLTVEGPEHNYFADGVLVHNKSSLVFEVDWVDDGQVPVDTDGDGLPDTGCGDSVDISITDPLGAPLWDFGMAETGSPSGWYGEDCLNGYGTTAVCHSIGLSHTLDEVASCTASDVVAGQTTLLDASKDPFLTYYFAVSGDCFVFGDDPTYYDVLGCTAL